MSSNGQKVNRGVLVKVTFSLFISLLPLIVIYALLVLNGKGFNVQIFIPTYNDEVAWFSQIEAMITHGYPLGYEGYNGTHAEIGTFGPWGIATLIPYAVIGKIIGWELHSMVIVNCILLTCAIGIFLVLVKPNFKQMIWIAIGYLCMYITIGYSMLAMAESLRYALAIIMAGMFIKLFRHEGGKIFKFCVVPLTMIYSIQVYLIFALVIPVYIFLIMEDKKILMKCIISIVVTGIVALFSNYLAGLVTSPYIESTRESLVKGILQNPYQGIVNVIQTFFTNIETVNPVNLVQLISKNHGVLVYFFLSYLLLVALIIKKYLESKQLSFYYMVSLYMLVGFLMGYCALYTGQAWTLCRGINTAIVFSVFVLVLEDNKSALKFLTIFAIIGSISNWFYISERIEQKNLAYAQASHILEERTAIGEIMDISKQNNIWDNTVAHYGTVTNVYLEFPPGTGTNYMMSGETNRLAKWAAISKVDGEANYKSVLENLIQNNHTVVYENEDLILLKKGIVDEETNI